MSFQKKNSRKNCENEDSKRETQVFNILNDILNGNGKEEKYKIIKKRH